MPSASVEDCSEYRIDNEDIIIAVMGATGTGKSNFVCKALGLPEDNTVGHSLRSCTDQVVARVLPLEGHRNLVLVDTPGFDDTSVGDARVLEIIANWLSLTYKQGTKLNGLIFLHKITDNRMQGSALRNLSMFRQLCGEECLSNILLVTTMWDCERQSRAESRETELIRDYWDSMITLGSRTERFDNTTESATRIITGLLGMSDIVLCIQRELVDDHKKLHDTAAGAVIDQELVNLKARHQETLEMLAEEHKAAMERQDAAAAALLQREKQRWEKELKDAEEARKVLHRGIQSEVAQKRFLGALLATAVTGTGWLIHGHQTAMAQLTLQYQQELVALSQQYQEAATTAIIKSATKLIGVSVVSNIASGIIGPIASSVAGWILR